MRENTFTLNLTLLKEGYQNIVASRVHGNIAQLNARLLFRSIFVSSSRHWNFNDGCAFVKENKTIFTVSLLKLNKTANFFSFKGTSSQSCAIAGCKNTCGTAAKCIKSLKGLYEIDDQWVHLHNTEVETLKVCNVHYNRDQRRHQKFSGPRHALANMTCLSCSISQWRPLKPSLATNI